MLNCNDVPQVASVRQELSGPGDLCWQLAVWLILAASWTKSCVNGATPGQPTDMTQYGSYFTVAPSTTSFKTSGWTDNWFCSFVFVCKNDSSVSGELDLPWESSRHSITWKLRSCTPHFSMQHFIKASCWVQTSKGSGGNKDYTIWVWTATISLCRTLGGRLKTAGKTDSWFLTYLWPPG